MLFLINLPQKTRHQDLSIASNTGSALVLVLLVTALLATIVVSYLSTARIEQIAARNFSRQNAAAGLAEMATQQAMAKIQLGFNTTANMTGNYSSVVTTQPGAIHKYLFQNGTITWNCTVEQFSAGNRSINGMVTPLSASISNATAYLNNLQSPSSNSSATSNQWTITGNASERINVFMENVTTTVNGTNQTVGRIAYYVDDEGTKLNLNAATGNRSTLNIAGSRSLSLSSVANATQAETFTQVINGNATNGGNATSDIKNWSYFFRPEQIGGAVSGFDPNAIPNLSAAPTGDMDYHLKKTPWGTDRLFINDLPIDSSGVDAIYNALSSPQLRDIYGTTFAEKYTDAGLKQIAANILQARHPNVLNDPTKSFTYNGSLLGAANATADFMAIANCCNTANATRVIPKDYLGNAPYPILNEIGVTVTFGGQYDSPTRLRLYLRPFVSIFNPWNVNFEKDAVGEWQIQMQIDSMRYTIRHKKDGVPYPPFDYGPSGYINDDAYGHTFNEGRWNAGNRQRGAPSGVLDETFMMGSGFASYCLGGNSSMFGENSKSSPQASPSYKIDLNAGQELQFPCPPFHNTTALTDGGFGAELHIPSGVEILDIRNIEIKFEYIRLLAKSNDGTTIRDWVLAEDLVVEGWLQNPVTLNNGHTLANGYPTDMSTLPSGKRQYVKREQTLPPIQSIKRIGGALKTSVNMGSTASPTPNPRAAWSDSSPATWVDPDKSGAVSSNYTTNATGDAETYPSATKVNEIPGDPTKTDSDLRFAFDPREHHLDSNDWPKIEFTNLTNTTGVFTSPADLGKIQTNIQHRKLRFTTQHPNEVAAGDGGVGNATFIPDWAMLDVISFGSNSTTVQLPPPLNLNGSFHVPSGSPLPVPRTAGLESVLKAIDSADLLGNSFNANNTVSTNRSQYMGSSGNVSSTVAGNIGNLTWSTGNFSAGSATWGAGNSTNDPGSRRKAKYLPVSHFVLPSEVTEIRGISDVVPLDNYTSNSANIKANEGRLSSLFPGATTQSRFFTIYAFAQALDKLGQIDGEAVTKTLVEVEEQTPVTTPPTYKVKKLYSQPISVP